MSIENQVLVWLDDYAACLEKILESYSFAPESPQSVIAKHRRERVLAYMADNATKEQLQALMIGYPLSGPPFPASYETEVAALETAKNAAVSRQRSGE